MNLTICVAAVLGVIALSGRWTGGSWVAPAPFFAVFWAGIMLVSGITFPDLASLPTAALYVAAACLSMWIGALVAHAYDPPGGRPARLSTLPALRGLLLFSLAVAIGEILSLFTRRGYSVLDMLSPVTIATVVIANRSGLYSGTLRQGTVEWIAFLVLYTSALLGGVLFRIRRRPRDAILGLAAPVLIAVTTGLYGSRFGALYGGAFWVGGFIATSALIGEDPRVFKPRALFLTVAIGSVLLLGLSIATQGVRYSQSFSAGTWRQIMADGFNFPAAFGIWLDGRGFYGSGFTAGARTFTRVVGVVGIRAPLLPAIPVQFTSSNIYTVFRDVIEDFGTIGSLLFFAGLGWIGQMIFSRARAGSVAMMAPLAVLYSFLLTTAAVGFFFYTVSTAAVVLFVAYAGAAFWVARRGPGRSRVLSWISRDESGAL